MALGKFIVLEGIDGSGKTTQARLLEDRLSQLGVKTLLTREPGGTEIGEKIRSFAFSNRFNPLMDMCLMYTARMFHLMQLVRPALECGTWVICDRFVTSTWAYQSNSVGRPEGVACRILHDAEDSLFRSGLPMPDLEIFLHLDIATSLDRLKTRSTSADRFEENLSLVLLGYQNRYSSFPPAYPIEVVDARANIAHVTDSLVDVIIRSCLES